MNEQISDFSKSLYFKVKKIAYISKFLAVDIGEKLFVSLNLSCLDHCN